MLDSKRVRRFYAALNGAGLIAQKDNILAGYGVESTLNLSAQQADEITKKLNDMQKEPREKADAAIRRHRSIVLTLLNHLGIYVTNNDWSRVNEYLSNPRIAGKVMYDMNVEELQALQRKLRVMTRDQKAIKEAEDFQAANN